MQYFHPAGALHQTKLSMLPHYENYRSDGYIFDCFVYLATLTIVSIIYQLLPRNSMCPVTLAMLLHK